jgi:hypothetical protein
MPFTYVNRRGVTYVLCEGLTASGKVRYYFAREETAKEPGHTPLDEIPPGYEIRENVNGQVSLAKVRPSPLHASEVDTVAAALTRHPNSQYYRHQAKGRVITIYETIGPNPALAVRAMARALGLDAAQEAEFLAEEIAYQRARSRYDPVMRITLTDKDRRRFTAEARSFWSGVDDWVVLAEDQPIGALANGFIPMLGTDRLFSIRIVRLK